MITLSWALVVIAILAYDLGCVVHEGQGYYGYEVTGVLFLLAGIGFIIVTIVQLIN